MKPPRKKPELPAELADLAARQEREQARLRARTPKRLGDVVNQMVHRRGYARVQSGATLANAWQEAAGASVAKQSRPGKLQRGVLEVVVSNSTLLQELTFDRMRLLGKLQALAPDQGIRDLKFRSGSIA